MFWHEQICHGLIFLLDLYQVPVLAFYGRESIRSTMLDARLPDKHKHAACGMQRDTEYGTVLVPGTKYKYLVPVVFGGMHASF